MQGVVRSHGPHSSRRAADSLRKGSRDRLLRTAMILRVLTNWALRNVPLAKVDKRILRLEHNPIITGSMLPPGDGDNINGPSLIRVPDWVEAPLGRYYLYFAHHRGTYIRMA